MTELINNLFSFPTLLYTGLVTFTILYWIAASFGLGDIDLGDGMELEGADIGDGAGWLNKFKLDGIPVSITITFTIFLSWIISFVAVHFYQDKITDGLIEVFVGFWVIVLAPLISAPIIGTLFSPLKPVFKRLKEDSEGRKAGSLIGYVVTVRTNKVTMTFGDAEIDHEGANLILKIRAEEPNEYKRGDSVVITDYIEDANTFRIRSR